MEVRWNMLKQPGHFTPTTIFGGEKDAADFSGLQCISG